MQSFVNKKEKLNPELSKYIEKSDRSGMTILRHPLVYSIPYTKELNHFLNKQYEYKSKQIEKYIKDSKWLRASYLYEKPYRMEFVYENMHEIPDDQYWKILKDVWVSTEFPCRAKYVWLTLFNIDKKFKETFMSKEDIEFLNNLPEKIKIYRGYQDHKYENGLSYSLSMKTAKFFSNRYGDIGYVKEIEVYKKDVFAYISDREEQEIIYLKDQY